MSGSIWHGVLLSGGGCFVRGYMSGGYMPGSTCPRTCLTHYTTRDRGQLNTHYHLTTHPSSPRSTYEMTIDCNKTDEHLQTTRKPTGHNLPKTQIPLLFRPQYPQTYTLLIEYSF